MFFLARSVFCIGLVAFLLPGSERVDDWKGLAQSARTTATDKLDTLCAAASSPCGINGVAQLVLTNAISTSWSGPVPRKSVSTLEAMDFVPPWRGRASHS